MFHSCCESVCNFRGSKLGGAVGIQSVKKLDAVKMFLLAVSEVTVHVGLSSSICEFEVASSSQQQDVGNKINLKKDES